MRRKNKIKFKTLVLECINNYEVDNSNSSTSNHTKIKMLIHTKTLTYELCFK